jgi:antitoxin (DNA-binding transcriptional repressor) of toxin-antitoxin stability system
MSDTAISVADAARDFLRVLDMVEQKREPAVLVRDGKPVATLNPILGPAQSCRELAERWPKLDKLPLEEGKAFADDLERSRANLPTLKPAWE